jgi:ferrous iron transport protein B
MKILLMGNPNVGKSVVFSRLTGVHVVASNYPGTTVELTKGWMEYKAQKAEVIDVPGAYTLEPTSRAEEVAVKVLKEGDLVINVVDATNLERNLNLTLQLIERGIPLVVVLNIWDETKHRGIDIDIERLEKLLGVPVIPTVGITGEGIKKLSSRLGEAKRRKPVKRTEHQRWDKIGKIVDSVQILSHRHHTFREILEEATARPVSGLPIALFILISSFGIIRFIAEGLIDYFLEPFFIKLYLPLITKLSLFLGGEGLFHDIFIGKLIGGGIDFVQSFGLLTTGLYVPLAMVLPYIISFYLVLGILEDTGYLPRLAVLLDNLMHRLGLHGYAIIPNLLGLGCNVPGILSVRILESRRERFIASTLISIGVPCAALQAMIFGLVGNYGGRYVAMVYGTLFLVWLILGYLLNRLLKGFSPPLLIEIPPYRWPSPSAVIKKLWMRILGFVIEALPLVLLGVLLVNILYFFRLFDFLANLVAPIVHGLLGLPKEAVVALVIGFLRKDVALGLLGPLNLTAQQLVVSSVVLAMFFPCVATFSVLLRELGFKDMLKATGIMLFSALAAGGILNFIL